MKVLITAGSTIAPIDQVRVISNIFKGRTGTAIAEYFAGQGAEVTLITSSPGLVKVERPKLKIVRYDTFDSLKAKMQEALTMCHKFDAVIHSAAISDYKTAGVYVEGNEGGLSVVDSTKKISSKHEALFLKLVPTEKLVDLIREEWHFHGVLVKFKLEVGITDEDLLEIAKKSRTDSDADLIVANCLEWATKRAYILGADKKIGVSRNGLPGALYQLVHRTCFGSVQDSTREEQ